MKKIKITLIIISLFIFPLISSAASDRKLSDLQFNIVSNTSKVCYSYVLHPETGYMPSGCVNSEKQVYILKSDSSVMLYTLFHEVGHYLLSHSSTTTDLAIIDKQEFEANLFAGYYILRIFGFKDNEILSIGLWNQIEINHFQEIVK